MTATIPNLINVLNQMGSDVVYHKETGGTPCPCLTPEGFRDPQWHLANPTATVCNEEGLIGALIVDMIVKASVQPATIGFRGRVAERLNAMFGEVERDDHFGIFPCEWNGTALAFADFSESGDDYVVYDGRRFLVVAADKIPDVDGDPNHHWELALRFVKLDRPTADVNAAIFPDPLMFPDPALLPQG